MTAQKLTQGKVGALASGPAPARDTLIWSDREAGFGLKGRAGSRRTAYVYQGATLIPVAGLTLGDARKVTLEDARKAMRARAGEIAADRNPVEERRRYQASPTFAEFVTRYLKSENWRRKAPSTQAGDQRRIQLYLLPALGRVLARHAHLRATGPRPRRAAITVTRYRAALWCEAGRQAREHTRAMRLVAPMVPSRHTEKLARLEREIAKAEGGLERQRCLAEALAAEGDRTDAAWAGVLAVVLRWAVEAMRDEAAELRRVLDQLPAR